MLKLYVIIITDSMNNTSNVIICRFVIGKDKSEVVSSNYIRIISFLGSSENLLLCQDNIPKSILFINLIPVCLTVHRNCKKN